LTVFRMPLPWLVVRKPIRDKAGHSRPLLQAITQPERALGLRLKVRPKVKGASALCATLVCFSLSLSNPHLSAHVAT